MTLATLRAGSAPPDTAAVSSRRGWNRRLLAPAAALVGAAALAYHFTLASLIDYPRLDTSLAYVPLVPLLALGIAVYRIIGYRGLPQPPRDVVSDVFFGLPLVLGAVALLMVVPVVSSAFYWTDRVDVLSAAFLVAGGAIVIYGTAWAWRVRGALLFLALGWPALYQHVFAAPVGWFADLTNSALVGVASHTPLLGAQARPGSAAVTVHPVTGGSLVIDVATACPTAGGAIGVLLFGGALAMLTSGSRGRKAAWLGAGVVIYWGLNLARFLVIASYARLHDPSFDIVGYHAVTGVLLLAAAFWAMLRLMPRFGLQLRRAWLSQAESLEWTLADARPNTGPVSTRQRPQSLRIAGLGIAAAVVVLLFVADQQLTPYAAFVDGTGTARVPSFSTVSLPSDWLRTLVVDHPSAKRYFGDNSSYQRYTLNAYRRATVVADVVRTPDRSLLEACSPENCYLFHNYSITSSRRVDLGSGVTALLLNYFEPAGQGQWAAVAWSWPVRHDGATQYESISLSGRVTSASGSVPDSASGNALRGAMLDLVNMFTSNSKQTASQASVYAPADRYLESVAVALVHTMVSAAG